MVLTQRPTSGSATVAGISLTPENGVEIRRRISIMPESPGLYLRLSVIENFECFADHTIGRPHEIFNVIHATLGLVLGLAAALLLVDGLGWRAMSAVFDRERLTTGTGS